MITQRSFTRRFYLAAMRAHLCGQNWLARRLLIIPNTSDRLPLLPGEEKRSPLVP